MRGLFAGGGLAVGLVCLATLLLAPAAWGANEYELNDSRETAFGPLAGATNYTATFETENDYEWYVFYVRTYSQVEVSGSMLPGANCYSSIRTVELLDADGQDVRTFSIGAPNETGRLNITLGAGRYYLEFRNTWSECVGDRYRFRVDPAAAITPSRECGEAIVSRDSTTPKLAAVDEKLDEKTAELAKANRAVKSAKAALNLLRKRGAPGFRKRRARNRLQAAKDVRDKVGAKQGRLQALSAQHQQALATAEGQIAASC